MCLVLCHKTLLGTYILDCQLEIECVQDHERFGVPVRVDRLNHLEWFDLGTEALMPPPLQGDQQSY